ncbi:MAG: rRNA pseudouridine synthase [Oscillospiraceae bacterium]|nr:rRNA pseudouridine synthase [Oscillospiraceae bacterium]
MEDNKIRLQKFLADAGIASRRKAEELIAAGRVRVNGRVASVGDKVDPKKDSVLFDGKKVKTENKFIYLVLNKPRGYVTTMSDENNRKCVAELILGVDKRVYPVGRLDRDSEGLLLFTNDGEFANAMTHPSKHIQKTYRVSVKPAVTDEHLTVLTSSLMIDGRLTMPAEVRVVANYPDKSILEFTIFEGRNRQIRRLCEEAGLETVRLKRLSIGKLTLGRLAPGEFRELKSDEIALLKRQSGCY